jgi:hypothetical protein
MKSPFFVLLILIGLFLSNMNCRKNNDTFKDPCGHELPAIGAMDVLTGTYKGLKICNGVESQTSLLVCRHPDKTDFLRIGNDDVPIDLSCTCFPDPSITGYRWYTARFMNDSLFLYTSQGALGNSVECNYFLKKNN